MPTRTVTGTFYTTSNAPLVGASIRFFLVDGFTASGVTYAPGIITATTGNDGSFSVSLPVPDSDDGSARYDVHTPDGFHRIFLSTGASITLASLLAIGGNQPSESALAAHANLTENIHGISDTADLVLTSDSRLSDARTPTAHTHDDRYFTESEVTSLLSGKSDTSHNHSGTYEPSGSSASAISAHVADADPHAQYHTNARGDARYSLISHTHPATSGLVAAAPAGPYLGQVYYATNALCARGVGDFYVWNGTDWRNADGNVMTTSIETYLIDCLRIGATRRGSLEWMTYDEHFGGGGTDIPTATSSGGTGSSVGISGILSADRPAQYLLGAGTAIGGRAGAHMLSHRAFRIDTSYAILATSVSFTGLSNATDEYNSHIGFDPGNAQDTSLASYGAWFKYDRGGAQGGLSGANWITVTRNSNVSTEIDTGIPVTTAFQNLALIMMPSSFKFYINGVLVATHTTNLPLGSGGGFCLRVYRTTNGSIARSMSSDWRFAGYRRATATTLF